MTRLLFILAVFLPTLLFGQHGAQIKFDFLEIVDTIKPADLEVSFGGEVNTDMTSGMNIGTASNTQASIWTNNVKRVSVNSEVGAIGARRTPEAVGETVVHELGHKAAGPEHSKDPNNLMYKWEGSGGKLTPQQLEKIIKGIDDSEQRKIQREPEKKMRPGGRIPE